MTYEQALEYIHGISWTFCKPGLDRIRQLCERLGNPQDSLRFIHVAGTNGKGSISAMLDSVLRTAGYRTGLYTSPYIVEFNERMRVNGNNIPNDTLAEITEMIRPIADAMTDKPTEFELITAIALEYFRREDVDVVIFEAGMGGRLDSTNVIKESTVSVISGIALDHTAFLGDTVEKISTEKAGIIKHGCPVVYGGRDDAADAIIRSTAAEHGSEYRRTEHGNIAVTDLSLEGSSFSYKGEEYRLSLLGTYQPDNAATVIEVCDLLGDRGFPLTREQIKKGLAAARWPARFEIIKQNPTVIFDGAHNPQGIESAVNGILAYWGNKRVYVVSGVLADKDYRFIAGELSRVAAEVFTITPDNPRALSAEKYAEEIMACGVNATPCPDIGTALERAVFAAEKNDTAAVCLGSLYTYAEVIKNIKEI